MPFNARVVRVLIASPSDTPNERRLLREVMEDWNSQHAEATHVMLLPVIWERDAVPELGDRPQAIVNRQIVDAADVLVGTFWTRLGTPTGEAASGTVEEIEKFVRAGKPVLLYFSSQPVVPDSIDAEQYAALIQFRKEVGKQGLYDVYATEQELWRKFSRAITQVVRDNIGSDADRSLDVLAITSGRPQASPIATVRREREASGFDNKGNPKYRSRERIVVENRGTAPAEQLQFEFELPPGVQGQVPHVFAEAPVTRLVPGASVEFPLMLSMATAPQWEVVLRWREGEVEHEDRQTVSG